MPNLKIVKYAFLNALSSAIYIALVATFMTKAEKILGKVNNILGAMTIQKKKVLSFL